GGTVYDGTGAAGVAADVGIRGDRIAAIAPSLPRDGATVIDAAGRAGAPGFINMLRWGTESLMIDGRCQRGLPPGRTPHSLREGATVIDAPGLAVAPGFINMLSWATESLIIDGRSQSDIRQGVTTEIFGEGVSMGPLNDAMKARWKSTQGEFTYDIDWTTLGEYLTFLEKRGISPNVASYVGATTIREHVIGLDDREPTEWELELMQELVREAMRDGALGVGSSLIYAPAFYASTEELIALAKAAGEYQGKYISHMRSEGNRFVEAVEELIRISREAGVPAEIYHLKAAGQTNWPKMDRVLEM